MPRKSLIHSTDLPYHVTARANNREPFYLPLERTWSILENQCFEISILFSARIHAFVVMNNHFHMLLTTPQENLGQIMMHFMRSTTQIVNSYTNRSGHVFDGRYHWSLIQSDLYFAHAYKYVFRNPVRAGTCATVESYPYSSLAGQLGLRPLRFPIFYPLGVGGHIKIPSDSVECLDWLNRPFQTEHQLAIQNALRRTRFEFQKTNRKSELGKHLMLL